MLPRWRMTSILLSKVLEAEGSDEAWFEGLLRWVLEAPVGAAGLAPGAAAGGTARPLETTPTGPAWKARIRAVWCHTSAVGLLADAGLPGTAPSSAKPWNGSSTGSRPAWIPRPISPRSCTGWTWTSGTRTGSRPCRGQGPWGELLALPAEALRTPCSSLAFRAAALGLSGTSWGWAPRSGSWIRPSPSFRGRRGPGRGGGAGLGRAPGHLPRAPQGGPGPPGGPRHQHASWSTAWTCWRPTWRAWGSWPPPPGRGLAGQAFAAG